MLNIDNNELLSFLEKEDEETRTERLQRMKTLINEFGEKERYILHYDLMSVYTFEEARLCYLEGLYIGCIFLAQATIEHFLAGLMHMDPDNDNMDKIGFNELINKAFEEKYISKEDYDIFNKLRQKRNIYVHFKKPMHEKNLLVRSVKDSKDYDDIMQEDALLAIKAMFILFNRQ